LWADRSLIEVLFEEGVDILTSCEEGTCGTVETAMFRTTLRCLVAGTIRG
jgi:hypothetical protein